jgi:hypothetical protein
MKERQTPAHQWDDKDEAEFVQRLQQELDKVSRFQEDKVRPIRSEMLGSFFRGANAFKQVLELSHTIAHYEELVKEFVESRPSSPRPPEDDLEDPGTDTEDFDTDIEERFIELEDDLETLIADVYDLGTRSLALVGDLR